MGRRPLRVAAAVLVAAVLGGCSDAALVDRVAAMEHSQDQLRASLRELGAPDPETVATQEALAADVAGLADQLSSVAGELSSVTEELTTLGTTVDELRADVTAGTQADAERLSAVETRLGELAGSLSAVQSAVTAAEQRIGTVSSSVDELTDRTTSLDVQLDAHADDPGAHAGAPGNP